MTTKNNDAIFEANPAGNDGITGTQRADVLRGDAGEDCITTGPSPRDFIKEARERAERPCNAPRIIQPNRMRTR